MKHIVSISTAFACMLGIASVNAQTLNVNCGNVNYHFDSSKTGVMLFNGGTELTILDKTFNISGITNISTTSEPISDNTVSIV